MKTILTPNQVKDSLNKLKEGETTYFEIENKADVETYILELTGPKRKFSSKLITKPTNLVEVWRIKFKTFGRKKKR